MAALAVPAMSVPSKRTVPAVGRKMPLTLLLRVDLPAPLEPSSATISPASTASETPRSTSTGP